MRTAMGYRSFVHVQVACALVVILAASTLGLRTIGVTSTPPLTLALKLSWVYALPLAASIMAVMFERAGSPDAILGYRSEATGPSLRQAILQNTLEQASLGFMALLAFGCSCPPQRAGLLMVAASLFIGGRLLFVAGYAISPMYRFFGFSLNFYASCALLGGAIWFQCVAQ
ncbi:MAPEG family protein [Dyella sp. 2RAF44]|uniref:MAPEG family protein n=2 Tax=unclassified Dyella TaxID=2634549 RepID=UPI003F90C93F